MGASNPSQKRLRGDQATRVIFESVVALLGRHSVRELSIEAVARHAGVSKTTIYRRWDCKSALVVDAFLDWTEPFIPFPKRAAPQEALEKQIAAVVRVFAGRKGRIVREIVAEGVCEPKSLAVFREHFLYKRRAAARAVIEQGQADGEFRSDVDPELAMDMLYGPIYYRLIVGHLPLTQEFAADLAEGALRCLTTK